MLIPTEYINALLCFAAKKDIRNHLNSIMLEILPSESRLVATDGCILGVFRICSTDNLPPMQIIIPREPLDKIKAKRGEFIDIIASPDNKEVTIKHGNSTVTCKAIDDRYPEYRMVIPDSYTGESAQFNGELLTNIIKAYKCLHTGFPAPLITHNGTDAALIDLNYDDFCGIAMPLNIKAMKGRNLLNHNQTWVK